MKKNRQNSGAERCWSPHIYQEIAGYSTRRHHNSASGSSKGKNYHGFGCGVAIVDIQN